MSWEIGGPLRPYAGGGKRKAGDGLWGDVKWQSLTVVGVGLGRIKWWGVAL